MNDYTWVLTTILILVAVSQPLYARTQKTCSDPASFLDCTKQQDVPSCDAYNAKADSILADSKDNIAKCFSDNKCVIPSSIDIVKSTWLTSDSIAAVARLQRKSDAELKKMLGSVDRCFGTLPHAAQACEDRDGERGPDIGIERFEQAGKQLCAAYTKCTNQRSVARCVTREIANTEKLVKNVWVEKCTVRGMRIYENFCGSNIKSSCEAANRGCTAFFATKQQDYCACAKQIDEKAQMIETLNPMLAVDEEADDLITADVKNHYKWARYRYLDVPFWDEVHNVCGNRDMCRTDAATMRRNINRKCYRIYTNLENVKVDFKNCLVNSIKRQIREYRRFRIQDFFDSCGPSHRFSAER